MPKSVAYKRVGKWVAGRQGSGPGALWEEPSRGERMAATTEEKEWRDGNGAERGFGGGTRRERYRQRDTSVKAVDTGLASVTTDSGGNGRATFPSEQR